MLVNINGTITSAQNATISVFDRGFLFGDSVYEVTRTYNQIPFLLKEHMQRLQRSADILGMELSYSIPYLQEQIKFSLKEFQKQFSSDAYIRLIVTRGISDMGLAPTESLQNNFVIIIASQPDNPSWWYEKGVSFIVADTRKTPKQTIDPNCKSGNHLPHVMALKQAKEQGTFDAIMLNQQGFVTEGTSNNIWMVSNDKIITPPLQSGILEGLTRKTVLEILKKEGRPAEERLFYPEQLYEAQECFFTSSTREIVPIVQIDDKKIGSGLPGPIYKKIHTLYKNFIQQYNLTQTPLDSES